MFTAFGLVLVGLRGGPTPGLSASVGVVRKSVPEKQNGPGEGRFARGIRGRWFA